MIDLKTFGGGSIGVLDYGYKEISIQQNGLTLINDGFKDGWKLHGRIKDYYDPHSVLKQREEKLQTNFLFCMYKKALCDLSSDLSVRAKIHTTISLMVNNPKKLNSIVRSIDKTIDINKLRRVCKAYRKAQKALL